MQRNDFNLNDNIPCVHFPSAEQNAPCLVVVPSVFGIDATFLLHTRRWLDAGLQVYALDSFWRTCPGPLVADEAGMAKAMERMQALADSDCDADVSALTRHVRKTHPDARLTGLGICFGGRPIVRAAVDGELDAVAAWHGVRIGELGDRLAQLACPASLQFGDIDAWSPAEEIAAIREATAKLPDIDIQVHADSDHGFTHLDRLELFNEAAYKASFEGLVAIATQ